MDCAYLSRERTTGRWRRVRSERWRLRYNELVECRVLLFASLAEKAGARQFDLELRPGDTVRTVRDRVFADYPALEPFGPRILYALDEEYATLDDEVRPGACLALIPPVSGG